MLTPLEKENENPRVNAALAVFDELPVPLADLSQMGTRSGLGCESSG
jgi:hypothetical protein